jgi:hypothetical protein
MEEATPQAPPPSRPTATGASVAKPTGPVAALLLAIGAGSLALAVLVIWAEASEGFKESLAYSDDVGPLSGKTIWAMVVFVLTWLILGVVLRKRDVNLRMATLVGALLVGLGLLGTFAPFFELFTAEE